MSVLNLIKVGAVCFAVGAAIGGGISAALVVRGVNRELDKDAAIKASQEFDAEIEASLRKTGGEELVMQYKAEVLRRTGKI